MQSESLWKKVMVVGTCVAGLFTGCAAVDLVDEPEPLPAPAAIESASNRIKIEGTPLSIDACCSMVPATRFLGLRNALTGTVVMVSSVPALLLSGDEDIAKMTERFPEKGMTEISRTDIQVDGHPALLMKVHQTRGVSDLHKWWLLVEHGGSTYMVIGMYNSSLPYDEEVRDMVLSIRFDEGEFNPLEALPFVFELGSFELEHVAAMAAQLRGKKVPEVGMIVARSHAVLRNPRGEFDLMLDGFAKRYPSFAASPIATLTIGPLTGFAVSSPQLGKDDAPQDLWIAQLSNERGEAFIVMAHTPRGRLDEFMPEIMAVVETMRFREQ